MVEAQFFYLRRYRRKHRELDEVQVAAIRDRVEQL